MMSRSSSRAFALLEEANVSLEDLLLKEINGGIGDINPIISFLDKSVESLNEFLEDIHCLQREMETSQYSDLPTLHTIDLVQKGEDFEASGIVDLAAWNEVVHTMKSSGFYAVLSTFKDKSVNIANQTVNLRACITKLEAQSRRGEVNSVVEDNLPGNFKVEFARLYSSWINFQSYFLASSMLSTELWYAYNIRGSLHDTKPRGGYRLVSGKIKSLPLFTSRGFFCNLYL